MSNFFFCHYVFKKPSAAEASESVFLWERVNILSVQSVGRWLIIPYLSAAFSILSPPSIKLLKSEGNFGSDALKLIRSPPFVSSTPMHRMPFRKNCTNRILDGKKSVRTCRSPYLRFYLTDLWPLPKCQTYLPIENCRVVTYNQSK